MRKIDNQSVRVAKTRIFKTLSGIAIAVVLLVMLTGIALATNVFGIADYFAGYFGELSDKQAEVLDGISATDILLVVSESADTESTVIEDGKTVHSVTSNGTTMTPLAAVADEDYLYLALIIEAPEGVVLSPNITGNYIPGTGSEPGGDGGYYQFSNPDEPDSDFEIVFDKSQYKSATYYPTWVWQDEEPGDNVVTCVIRATATVTDDLKWNDGIPKTIRIPGLWSQSPDKVYTKVLDGLWEFEINGFGIIEPIALEVEGLVTYPYTETQGGNNAEPEESLYEREELKMTLEYMTVSPLGIQYSYAYAYSDEIIPGPGVFQAVMKDGRKIELWQSDASYLTEDGGETKRTVTHANFLEPIILDDLDYIQFGELILNARKYCSID